MIDRIRKKCRTSSSGLPKKWYRLIVPAHIGFQFAMKTPTVQSEAITVSSTTGGVQIHRTYLTVRVRNLSGSRTWNLMKNGLNPSDTSSAVLSRRLLNL